MSGFLQPLRPDHSRLRPKGPGLPLLLPDLGDRYLKTYGEPQAEVRVL